MIRFVFWDWEEGQWMYSRKMLLESSQDFSKNLGMGAYLMCPRNSKWVTVVDVQSRPEGQKSKLLRASGAGRERGWKAQLNFVVL